MNDMAYVTPIASEGDHIVRIHAATELLSTQTHVLSGMTRPRIEPGSPRWEANRLTAQPQRLHCREFTPKKTARLPLRLAEQGSIPGGVASGFPHVGVVPDDAAGRCVFSGISHFPHPYIQALLHNHLPSPSSALKISILRLLAEPAHDAHSTLSPLEITTVEYRQRRKGKSPYVFERSRRQIILLHAPRAAQTRGANASSRGRSSLTLLLRVLCTCASKVKKRWSDTGDTNTHAYRFIAPTRKACSVSVLTLYCRVGPPSGEFMSREFGRLCGVNRKTTSEKRSAGSDQRKMGNAVRDMGKPTLRTWETAFRDTLYLHDDSTTDLLETQIHNKRALNSSNGAECSVAESSGDKVAGSRGKDYLFERDSRPAAVGADTPRMTKSRRTKKGSTTRKRTKLLCHFRPLRCSRVAGCSVKVAVKTPTFSLPSPLEFAMLNLHASPFYRHFERFQIAQFMST
ncbi:hypothetical protein PR048_017721 [Dryococelus australis]|uniref:Uncharacterized protein n=1 Tax=Dryococelus australis TaxID=614101 RepID=A0ABQ9HAJ1_9NEOP|nr:hypothetical protein PR048_017721 [Dryococelus australis]